MIRLIQDFYLIYAYNYHIGVDGFRNHYIKALFWLMMNV